MTIVKTILVQPIGNISAGDRITFDYRFKPRYGIVEKLGISNDGVKIITCWIRSEKQYKAFRLDGMTDLRKIKTGFIAQIMGW